MNPAVLGDALLITFVACCVVSAVLQVVAWSRHSARGARVSIRTLWKPERHFDGLGLRLMQLARRFLILGGIAYLGYGAVLIFLNTTGH